MSRLDGIKAIGGQLKETMMEYGAMQDAYDAAFDIEKGVYDNEAGSVEADHPAFEEADSIGELFAAYQDVAGVDIARYMADGFRASDDEDISALSEDMKEYAGGGLTGAVFASFVIQEDYDTAAAIAGKDPETVESALAETVGQYHELRAERYGLPPNELDEDAAEKIDLAKDLLRPVIDARQEDADLLGYIAAAEEVADHPQVRMAYQMARAQATGEEPDMAEMLGLEDLETPSPEDQQEAVEALVEDLFADLPDDMDDAGLDADMSLTGGEDLFAADAGFSGVADEPLEENTAAEPAGHTYETAEEFLAEDDDAFEAYTTIHSFQNELEAVDEADADALAEAREAQRTVMEAAQDAGLPENELDELEDKIDF